MFTMVYVQLSVALVAGTACLPDCLPNLIPPLPAGIYTTSQERGQSMQTSMIRQHAGMSTLQDHLQRTVKVDMSGNRRFDRRVSSSRARYLGIVKKMHRQLDYT